MIEAKNIYLSYDDNKYVIKKGSFSIKPKEFIFIGGNSGSGKSTLLKSFYGDIPLKHGSLKIENQEVFGIKGKKLRILRKDIGIIFQDYKLINEYTIEENIMIPLKINGYSDEISKDQANKLLAHVRLSHRAGYHPNELSGGEQQRVAVARALAHNPKIIIADEPTGNLDSKTSLDVLGLIKVISQKYHQTVVIITHNDEIAQMAGRIVRIEDGKIVGGI